MKSTFSKSLLVLCVPFVLGISFEQAALRADYQLAWSSQRPSALPFWRNQLAAAASGSFPTDYYPAFPLLLGYSVGFSALAIAVSFVVLSTLKPRVSAARLFALSLVTLALLLVAALHFARLATIHHVFHA